MLVDQMMYIQEMDSKVSFKFNKISKSRLEKILPLAQVSCLVKPILLGHKPFLARQVSITHLIPLHEKFLQFDWLRAVVFQLNLKYLHVKITNLLRVVV